MATDALGVPKSLRSKPSFRPVNRTAERIFFGGMAVLLCAVVFYGFSRTYYLAGLLHAPLPGPMFHIHGAAFTLWMLLFLAQTALISARRVAWHRTFGTIAFCLPPVMILLGYIVALESLHMGTQIGPLDPAVSLSIPLIGITWFAVLIFASWRTRRTPDSHKRLILFSTIALSDAAIGRFPWRQIGLPPAAGAVTGLGILILLVVAYDLVSLRRLHRSTIWAAPITFATGALAVPIGMTPAWHAFAAFLDRTIASHL